MTFTYHSTLLDNTSSTGYQRTVVRMLIGDTSTSRRYNLDDAEVDWFVTNGGGLYRAAASAAEALAAQYVEAAESKQVGDLRLTRKEGDRLNRLAAQLRRKATAGATPIVGGVSIADKQDREADTDRTTPSFIRGQHDYPGSGQPGGRATIDWST